MIPILNRLLTTVAGWIVQFLVAVRHGEPEKVGYVASIFWCGFTLGRIALADVTHRFGERRMVFIYITLAVIFQLMFWLIPSILINAISVCLLGMLPATLRCQTRQYNNWIDI